jgi:2-polyprenyl-6-hydroxyphenyl methylase/3-demethylubiquinone-9 3-methyltransferase
VVGVDPSSVSIEAARRHAAANGLEIDYRVGAGEQLPAEESSFDVVYCCDVLEHVSNLDRVVSEAARVSPSAWRVIRRPGRAAAHL